jgi:hypothetical protein
MGSLAEQLLRKQNKTKKKKKIRENYKLKAKQNKNLICNSQRCSKFCVFLFSIKIILDEVWKFEKKNYKKCEKATTRMFSQFDIF